MDFITSGLGFSGLPVRLGSFSIIFEKSSVRFLAVFLVVFEIGTSSFP
jgi:hypothetical protein